MSTITPYHLLSEGDLETIRSYDPGFQPFADCLSGIQELETIRDERAASPAWNAKIDAAMRRAKLASAIHALKVAAAITYFETNGTPTTPNQ